MIFWLLMVLGGILVCILRGQSRAAVSALLEAGTKMRAFSPPVMEAGEKNILTGGAGGVIWKKRLQARIVRGQGGNL